MKFLATREAERPHLKLYNDQEIDVLNIDRVLSQDSTKKELQDVVQSLQFGKTIKHFTHHSDKQNMDEAFSAEQRIKQLQQQLDPQYLNKQNPQQQQATRTSVHQQTIPLQEKLSLLQQVQQIIKQGLSVNELITYLDLSNTFMRDDLAVELSKMFVVNANLMYLNLSGNNLTEKGGLAITSGLSKNKTLQYLNLSHNSLTPKVIENLATNLEANISLTDLNLSHNPQGGQILASDSIVAILDKNELIASLSLNNMNLGSNGLTKLLDVVTQHQALRNLNISTNGLDSSSLNSLVKLLSYEESKLQSLNISENRINLDELLLLTNSLKDNNSLKILELSRIGNLEREGGKCLGLFITANKSLIKLDISHNGLGFLGTYEVREGLVKNSTLSELNMIGNNLDEAGCIFIAKGLEVNKNLITLDLRDNHIQSTGAIYLAGMLEQYNHIKYLNLAGNQIDDSGIEAIAYVMKNLKLLNLSNNQITENGAKFLAESIQSGIVLKALILNNNYLQVAGVLEIISALKDNSSLHTLGLKSVNIGDAGVEQIVPILLENIGIAKLDLSSNSIAKNGTTHIANLLKENSFITSVNLSGNQLTEEGEAALIESIPASNVTFLGNIADKLGGIKKALSFNINNLQIKLKVLKTNNDKDLTAEDVFKLYHQVLARKESSLPELSYTEIQDDKSYLKAIDSILKTIKNQNLANLEANRESHQMIESANQDALLNSLDAIDILGDLELPVDLVC
jgi:Ran GTPase-activating protein (RanGAP) involved in mRNA processing and transport